MELPVIVAVDDDTTALERVRVQLLDRYGNSYRVECVGAAADGLQLLERLAGEGADVALVLAGRAAAAGGAPDQARRDHPLARRVLLVSDNVWVHPDSAEAIRAAMAAGRVDHFILRPGPPPDEVFHESIASFLLEWARERRL